MQPLSSSSCLLCYASASQDDGSLHEASYGRAYRSLPKATSQSIHTRGKSSSSSYLYSLAHFHSELQPISTRVVYFGFVLHVKPIEDCRFVSDDPTVMSCWNVGHISGAEFDFLAIVRSHTQSTWDQDSEMVHLTGFCFGEGFDVFWPLPSRLISMLWYCHVTYCDVFYPCIRRSLSLIRFLKILFL